MKQVYGIFKGEEWTRSSNKKEAILFARRHGATVRALSANIPVSDKKSFLLWSVQIWPAVVQEKKKKVLLGIMRKS